MAPLRFDTPAEQCSGPRDRGPGSGGRSLLAALLGGLLLTPAAAAAPQLRGSAAILGGVIQKGPDGDRPAQPTTTPDRPEAAVPTPATQAFNARQAASDGILTPSLRNGNNDSLPGGDSASASRALPAEVSLPLSPATPPSGPAGDRGPIPPRSAAGPPQPRPNSLRATPGISPGSGRLAAVSPPNPEPGVLVPRSGELGNDQPIRPAPADGSGSRPAGAAEATAGASARELVLDRRRRQLLVIDNGMPLRRFPVAVGMPGWETPVGRFAVIEMRTDPVWEHPVSGLRIQPGPDNPLGSRWIGFHRDCKGRSGFNGQEHLVVQGCVVAGFHGTPNRASIGRAASHGCVRLYDEHVRDLFNLVRVGTPVTVLP